MNFGLVLLVLGGFLLGGAWSVWRTDEDAGARGTGRRSCSPSSCCSPPCWRRRRASCAWCERRRRGAVPRASCPPTRRCAGCSSGRRRSGVGDWWLTAGVLFQTVWNSLTGRPPGTGIRDADLFYFDADTSWEAEDAVIRAGADLFADLPVPVEIRNEARVHLWYAERFGVAGAAAFRNSREAIDAFAAVCCMSASRSGRTGTRGSTRRTATTTCSGWCCGPTRTAPRHGTSTRARRSGGSSTGRS